MKKIVYLIACITSSSLLTAQTVLLHAKVIQSTTKPSTQGIENFKKFSNEVDIYSFTEGGKKYYVLIGYPKAENKADATAAARILYDRGDGI